MNTIARLTLAAAAVAFAIWLAPASVHIVGWPSSGPVRVAFLQPLAPFWIAAAIAATATVMTALAWRWRGRALDGVATALAPLVLLLLWLVPFLPWLPDRAPLLLLLAGPLKWAVAAAAVVATAVALVGSTTGWRLRPVRLSRAAVFAIGLAVYSVGAFQHVRDPAFSGDEPHYLVITHSLVADRDLDIANNHAQRDYRAFFGGDLRPDFLRRGRHGEIYSVHAPGLPALLAPAYALGGASAATFVMAGLGAGTALAIFDAAAAIAGIETATIVWAATALTVPFVPHAWLIYPEMPAALIVALAALWLYRPPPSSAGQLVVHGLVLAMLPWLHTKFIVLLAVLAVAQAIRLWPERRTIAAFLAPIAISGAVWLYSFYRMYGVFDPEAPYGNYPQTFVLWQNVPRGIAGLLFDQKFGLLPHSPIYCLALAGGWFMLRDRKWRGYAAVLILATLAFVASSTRLYMWWGGSSAPARFLVPVVPLLAPIVAVAVERGRQRAAGRAAIAAATFVGISIAAAGIWSTRQAFFFSSPHGYSALAQAIEGSAPLDFSLPTFTEGDWPAPLTALIPWLAALAAGALAASAVRRRLTAFWIASLAGTTFLTMASFLVAGNRFIDRDRVVTRGLLDLMHAYDPSRFHAVDGSHAARLTPADVISASALTIRSTGASDNPAQRLDGPFNLPEGTYEARVWFDGERAVDGDAVVTLGRNVVAARAPAGSVVRLPFTLPLQVPVYVGTTDERSARAISRIDIVPIALVPRSARLPFAAHTVEPTDGPVAGSIAYVDSHTYPEGGVYWTQGTEEGTVVVGTAGASMLRLILHGGPNGAPVSVRAGEQRIDLELTPGETGELSIPLAPGTVRLPLAVRASRSFRPAELDPQSDDYRKLGCQVRAQLQ